MSKAKKMDIGSMMSFNNKARSSYSMEHIKEPILQTGDKIVKIDIAELEQAPDEWNFYPALPEEEFENLVFSILEHGLLHPIVVRRIDDKNIILSGHNRVRAYRAIAEDIRLLEKEEEGRYLETLSDHLKLIDFEQIMAVIKEEITDDEAREIIIDANYVQRQLSPRLITRSVIEKYRIIQDKRKVSNDEQYKAQKTREIVAKDFKLSGRHIDRYKRLEKLDEQILELFYQGRISLELASKIAGLKPKVQEHIAEEYLSILPKYPSKIAQELKPSLTMKDVDEIFSERVLPQDQIKIQIVEDGKSSHYVIDDENLIRQIKKMIHA
ncbi:MAG: ParB N-terminal domain-containing protein [Peptostreptococcaceae bacterium]|nr:ParB N-terminal domain-containing protein [Peptostreptococcaceae bacterium]